MGGNSLVAPVTSSTSWYTGMGVLDNAMSAYDGISNGDWAEGITNAAVGALGLLGAIADPLAAAISAGVGWVLEHCKPFREALDKLAGNPDVINSFAATWHNVSGALKNAAEELRQIVSADTARWKSGAVDAYRGVANAEAEMIMAAGVASAGIGGAVAMGGVVVATVRATVRDLISEAIGNIISKALQALTVVLIPKVVPEIIALVAKWSVRIAGWLRKLVRVISRLAELCSKLKPIFTKAGELDEAVKSGIDGALAKVPGLKDPALNPRTVTIPGLPGQPSFTSYPRPTLANNAATEGSKPVQD
jgi:hypothetical protein